MVPPVPDRSVVARENEQVLGVLVVLHGAVHLVGWSLSWDLGIIEPTAADDVWPAPGTGPAWVVGVWWLATAVGLVVVGARLAAARDLRRRTLVLALASSVLVTATSLPVAAAGTAASAAMLAAIAVLALRRRWAPGTRAEDPALPGVDHHDAGVRRLGDPRRDASP